MSTDEILNIDLLAFESGTPQERTAVVDATMRSLTNGFVYAATDLSESLLDDAYGKLDEFFALDAAAKDAYTVPGSSAQVGYTGLLVEQAEALDTPDWKEMLNWPSLPIPSAHPLRTKYANRYMDPVFPDADVPGIGDTLSRFSTDVLDVQMRVLRIIATGLGVDENYFDLMCTHGAHLSRAIHYPSMDLAPGDDHVWAGRHGDINLITALPRATASGLQVWIDGEGNDDGYWVDATPPTGHVILNTGLMLETVTNGLIGAGIHQVVSDSPGARMSVVQFAHPAPQMMLAPLPTCVTPANPLRYPTQSAADALDEVLHAIGVSN